MNPRAADDPRTTQILEACYDAICAGREPDLEQLCAGAPELRGPVERMLRRERELVGSCAGASGPGAASETAAAVLRAMPERVGDFTVLEPIGIGGMSHVYRARQEPLGREVALKVLRDEVVASATGRLRFAREATITAALDHPHIVPVYGAGEAGGRVYLAMKLLRGQSLDRLALPLPPDQVARIGAEVASALQAAHDIGVVHRDLKPANIVVENGHAYVVDFGLAVFAREASMLTQPNSTPGTLIYLPPELVRQRGAGLDARVDVYSLGASLYEVLAGRPPFDPNNPVRALHQILHVDPQALGLRGRDRDLETIVLRAMDKAPQRRFQTAAEMVAEFERYRAGLPIRSRRIGVWERAVRVVRRHRTTSALVATVLILLLSLAGMLGLRQHESRQRIARGIEATHGAIDRGDVAAARSQLAELAREGAPADDLRGLTSELESERHLQLLVALLQNPITHHDPRLIAELTASVAGSSTAVAKSLRADATLAIASRLLDEPVGHRPLAVNTRAAWPRTAAVLPAWTAKTDPEAALASLGDRSGGALDHLFAAMVLRLAYRAESSVEAELRRARPQGGDGASIRFSLAISFEAQGRYRGAYDLLTQLVDDPVYNSLASSGCARLAAHLGDAAAARAHLRVALNTDDPLTQSLSLLSELQVLDKLGEVETFWQRWNAAKSRSAHLPQFWLRGGYAAAVRLDDPDAAARARECFTAGLGCNPDAARRAALERALLQLDWKTSPASASLDPLPDDAACADERQRLTTLAQRAERLAVQAAASTVEPAIPAAALLVAAQASRAVGDRARSWALLERVCRQYGQPEALSQFAFQVCYRVLQVQLNEPGFADGDAEVAGPLDEAAAQGLVYAQRVAAIAGERPVDARIVAQAEQAAFVCAFHTGDAAVALPLAVKLRRDAGLPEPIRLACDLAVDWGGVRLERLALAPARRCTLLREALRTLGEELAMGHLDGDAVEAAIERWSADATVGPTREDPAWSVFWQDATALLNQLRR